MKKYIFLTVIFLFPWFLRSQDVITFNSPYTGSGTERACEGIVLKPGFSCSSSSGQSLTLRVDPGVCSTYKEDVISVSSSQNYIITVTPLTETDKVEISNGSIEAARGAAYLTTIDYLDGLGRPVQRVEKGITPSGNDLVGITEYDAFGREYRQWLPAPVSGKNGAFVETDYFQTASTNFHRNSHLYSETLYEASPLNRVIAEQNPGAQFYEHPKRISYGTNKANEVKQFVVNQSDKLEAKGSYPSPLPFTKQHTRMRTATH